MELHEDDAFAAIGRLYMVTLQQDKTIKELRYALNEALSQPEEPEDKDPEA